MPKLAQPEVKAAWKPGFFSRLAALIASQAVQDGVLSLLLLWLARTDQSGYGLFVFGAGVAAMMRSVLALGLDQYAIREFALAEQPRADLLRQMVRLKSLLSLLILAGLAGFSLVKGWGTHQALVVLVISLGRALDGVADAFFAVYRADGRQVREGAFQALANLSAAAWGVAAMLLGLGVLGLASFVVLAGGLKVALAVQGGLKLDLSRWWSFELGFLPAGQVRAVLTIAGVSVLGSLYNYAQIFLLKQFHPLVEVAVYGAASDLANYLSGLVSSLLIGAILYPHLAQAATRGRGEVALMTRRYLGRLGLLGLAAGLFLSTLGGLVLTLLYGAKYEASVPLLRILGPATTLSFVNNLAIFAMLALREERRLLTYHLLPAGLCFGLGLWLIPWLGAEAAAINLLAARLGMFFLAVGWVYFKLLRR